MNKDIAEKVKNALGVINDSRLYIDILGLCLRYPKSIESILYDVSVGKRGWELSIYDAVRMEKLDFIKKLNMKPEATKGLFICKSCGCDEFYTWKQQTRSADEQMTTFAQCAKCNKRIKQ